MIARRVLIAGRVQGVGFRAWVKREALTRGLSGWVRNRADGDVEALVGGEESAVQAMVAACRLGPRMAEVVSVVETEAELPQTVGFEIRPTV